MHASVHAACLHVCVCSISVSYLHGACAKIDLTFDCLLWSPIIIYTCMVFIALLRFAFSLRGLQ